MAYRPPGAAAPAPPPASSGYNSAQQPATASYGYGSAPAPAPAASGYSSYSTTTPAASTGYSASYSNAAPANPSAYNPSYSAAPSTTPAISRTPDFSQALNVPPPVQQPVQQSSYQSSYQQQQQPTFSTVPPHRSPNDQVSPYGGGGPMPAATGGAIAASAANSSVLHGGPTGGLVSEGNPTKCHKVDYEIKGHEMQLVEIELDPQETVIAEAGAMMYLDDGIDFQTKFGDGSEPKKGFFQQLMSAGGRLLTGESLFITHFSNQGQAKARVAFAAPYPGSIVPVNLQNYGNSIICQKDAFLCAAHGTSLKIHFNKKIGSGLFGGEGFILQKLQGDGMAFIHAGGTIIKRELRGEKLRLDTGCVVAFTEGITFDIQLVKGLKSMFFGGEGLFLATLQGTGTVFMQSLPFSRMCDRIVQSAPSIGGGRQGEGSALTGRVGDVLDGDGFGMNSLVGRF